MNQTQIQINFETPGVDEFTDRERQILSLIYHGRDKAISMFSLANEVHITTRELQQIVQHLINDHGVLIASATGKNHGYFYPETEEEFRAAAAQLEHRIISLAKRLRALNKESYEAIFGQGNLLATEGTEK